MNKQQFLSQLYCAPSFKMPAQLSRTKTPVEAAVLMPLVERDDNLHLLFTERAAHLTHHPGQISFPGGKRENGDITLIDTALREAREEIGLPERNSRIIGYLPRYTTITGFEISAVLALVNPQFTLAVDANEVKEVFEVPLEYLLDSANQHIEYIHRNGQRHQVHLIVWQDKVIWGATAALIHTVASLFR